VKSLLSLSCFLLSLSFNDNNERTKKERNKEHKYSKSVTWNDECAKK